MITGGALKKNETMIPQFVLSEYFNIVNNISNGLRKLIAGQIDIFIYVKKKNNFNIMQ